MRMNNYLSFIKNDKLILVFLSSHSLPDIPLNKVVEKEAVVVI